MVASSTAIREEPFATGTWRMPQRMLGRPFRWRARYKTGTGQGRKLVVPTLNLEN
jgi:FAD synthase